MFKPKSKVIFSLLSLGLALFLFHQAVPALRLPERRLWFGRTAVDVREAVTAAEKIKGLSGQTSLAADRGLLFIYFTDVTPGFWLKDMRFPIDIVWLDADWQVVAIDQNLSPATFPQVFYPPSPIRYVLEVNAGFAGAHDIEVRDRAVTSFD